MDIEAILANKGREVRTVRPEAPAAEALHQMREKRVSALVVSEDGARIAGIISDRGIMDAIADRSAEVLNAPVVSVMTKEVFRARPRKNQALSRSCKFLARPRDVEASSAFPVTMADFTTTQLLSQGLVSA